MRHVVTAGRLVNAAGRLRASHSFTERARTFPFLYFSSSVTKRPSFEAKMDRGTLTTESKPSSSYTEEHFFRDGDLLQKVLDITLKEKLMTRTEESTPVVNFKHPEELKKIIPMSLSTSGCKSVKEFEDIIEAIVKYSVKTTHPHFVNQQYKGVDEVALSGAWLLESLNTNQHTYEVAPVFIILEHFLIHEMIRLFGWEDGDGIFSPGGSTSNMYGISLARHKKYPEMKQTGFFGQKEMVLFTSDMSHYSFQKAASWMGFGTNQLVKVASDEYGRMRGPALREAIQKVRKEGKEPLFVNATCGSTVFGSCDPIDELVQVCKDEDIWLHVDACWGGSAILSQKHKHLLKGIEGVDSLAWNPHKMIGAPLQCSVFLVKYKGLLADCNRVGASYLFQADKFYDMSYDLGDKSIQCGRKADVLKLWLMFKVHGMGLYEKRVDASFDAARYLEEEVAKRKGFRPVVAERDFTNVCFWYIPPSLRGEEETEDFWNKIHKVAPAIKARMVKEGSMLLAYQPLESKNLVNFFRLVVTGFPVSTREDMDFVLDEVERLGNDL